MRQHAQELSETESDIQRRAAPLKPIVWWMEGGLYCAGRKDFVDFFSYVPPWCLAGISQIWPKAKTTDVVWALRFSKVGKEIRGIFKNSPQCFSPCVSLFSQCPHIVYKSVGHNHAFQFSFVNCGLKPHRLLVVHIIIYVIVIHIHFGSVLLCTTHDHQLINWYKKKNWFGEN
jgi:hypothetical protein